MGLLDIIKKNKEATIKPYDYEAWYNKGIVLDDLGRKEEALKAYDKAIEFKLNDHEAWNNKGIVLDDLGRKEEALKAYDKAIEFKPDKQEAWYNKGNVLNSLGRKEEALKAYDKAIEFKPNDHEAWYNKGIVLNSLGRKEEALKAYEKAIEFKPNYHEAWYNKGIVLNSLGRKEEALKAYEKAIEFKPNDHEAWNNKGNVLCELEKYKEAIECYSKVKELNPETKDIQKKLTHAEFKDREKKTKTNGQIPLLEIFEYDIAISYASENREIITKIAKKLRENNVRVFFDEFEKTKLWGKNLSMHFQQVYGKKSCFVLVFVSKEYSIKDWTNFEFTIARDAAKTKKTEFILPVRLDNALFVGLPSNIAYLDFTIEGIEGIVNAVVSKINDLNRF